MASYNLILDTKFKPFTYEELAAPLIEATKQQQALEEAYSEYQSNAGLLQSIINGEKADSKAATMYNRYLEDIQKASKQLDAYGLQGPVSRRTLFGLKARYNSEIGSIAKAATRREELAKEQRELIAKDPTMRFERYANKMSIDDLMDNPSLDYGRGFSAEVLRNQVKDAVSSYAKQISQHGNLKSIGLPYQYEDLIKRGATPEDITAIIYNEANRGNAKAKQFLVGVRDSIMKESGITDWAKGDVYNYYLNAANAGLTAAIGEDTLTPYKDDYGMQMGLYHAQKKEEAAEENLKNLLDLPIDVYELSSPNGMINKYEGAQELEKLLGITGLNEKGDVIRRNRNTKINIISPFQYGNGPLNEQTIGINIFTKDGLLKSAQDIAKDLVTEYQKEREENNKNGTANKKSMLYQLHGVYSSASQEEFEKDPYKSALRIANTIKRAYKLQVNKFFSDTELGGKYDLHTVNAAIQKAKKLRGATTTQGIQLNFDGEKTNQRVFNTIINNNTDSEGKVRLYNINGYTIDGAVNKGERVSIDDLIDDKGELKGNPTFYITANNIDSGLIIQMNGKHYYLDSTYMGSAAQEVINTNNNLIQYILNERKQLKTLYGDNWENTQEGQNNIYAYQVASNNYIKGMSKALNINYKVEPQKIQ